MMGVLPVRATASAALGDVPVADYVRLHVLASDDGDEAQALKLEVRDAVLACARVLLGDCRDADEAWTAVNGQLGVLEDAARARARSAGYDGPVTAQAGVFDFPDRAYGDVWVPAGRYRALRVVIGAGEGHNWWCVLYPSLCLPEELEPGEPVEFHSTLLDWLRSLFGWGDAPMGEGDGGTLQAAIPGGDGA